jgi:hypothetical protein
VDLCDEPIVAVNCNVPCNKLIPVNLFPTYCTRAYIKVRAGDVFRCKLMYLTHYIFIYMYIYLPGVPSACYVAATSFAVNTSVYHRTI